MGTRRAGEGPRPSGIAVRALVFAVCSMPLGAFGGWLFASSQRSQWIELPLLPSIIASVSILASVSGLVGLVQGLRSYSADSAAHRRMQHQQYLNEQQAARNRQEEQSLAVNAARYCSDAALRSYRSAVHHLVAASTAVTAAGKHRDRGAFTPFWSAVEEGYEHLGQHNQDLDSIRARADQYPSLLRRAAEIAGARLNEVPPFPLEARKIADIDPGSLIAGELQILSYDAQRDFQFASIFEQRRTTSAVIGGFASLSAAVAGMTSAIHESTQSMVASVDGVSAETRRVNDSLNVTGYSPVTGSVASEVRQLNEHLARLSRR